MRAQERRYGYEAERLIVIQRSKFKVFAAGFTAGLAAAFSLIGLLQLCWCL